MQIDRVDSRAKAAPRNAPYWQKVGQGRYVGWRKLKRGSLGTWLARYYTGSKYEYRPLGDFADVPERDKFDAAKRAAEQWFVHLAHGGVAKAGTVADACAAYVQDLQTKGRTLAAREATGRFKTYTDKRLGAVSLEKLTPRHLADWRGALVARGLKPQSINRTATSLRAALRLALRHGAVTSDRAWREELRPLKEEPAKRGIYLKREERAALVGHAREELRPLLRSLMLLPLRVGEAAALRVEHLDVAHKSLRIEHSKTGPREIPLSDSALAHLQSCAKGKLPSMPLLGRADGSAWSRQTWARPVHEAAEAAGLPPAVVAYDLRHSTITDLVTGGADLFTIAKIAGTSIRMIERTYGHLQREHARVALEALA